MKPWKSVTAQINVEVGRVLETIEDNKGRFCNTMASVALVHTSIRSHSSAPESNKQTPRDRTLDLPFFFRYKHIPSLKNLPSPNERVAVLVSGQLCGFVCFQFLLERISFVGIRLSL